MRTVRSAFSPGLDIRSNPLHCCDKRTLRTRQLTWFRRKSHPALTFISASERICVRSCALPNHFCPNIDLFSFPLYSISRKRVDFSRQARNQYSLDTPLLYFIVGNTITFLCWLDTQRKANLSSFLCSVPGARLTFYLVIPTHKTSFLSSPNDIRRWYC